MTDDGFTFENLCELTLITPGFDDLDLTGDTVDASGNAYTIDACELSESDDGIGWGTPVPVDTAVARWKTDGAIAQTQNHENREITFHVMVSAETADELAIGEAALALRASQPGWLRWTPPQGEGDATPTDFEVWTWHLEHAFDGLDERYTRRMYQVTMTAKPWAKSSTLSTVPALTIPGSPTTTLVDACTSTTGWTGSPNAVSTSGGAVKETVTIDRSKPNPHATGILTRTGSVTGLGVTPILALQVSVTGGTLANLFVLADGVGLAKVGQVGVTSYWQMPAGVTSLTALKVLADVAANKTAVVMVLSIADVSKTDTIAGVGSRKQLSRSLDVGGSVRTSGSIKVASPDTTPLGTVLVYTQPDNGMGFNPGLRQYRTSGNTPSSQATAVSGFRESLTAGLITFTPPANVLPQGTYVALARVFATAAGTTNIGGSVGTGSMAPVTALSGQVTWTVANTYQWVNLGSLTFPYLALPDESTVASFVNLIAVGGTGVALDEMYLLDVTHGAYSLIDCGATATRLWLDAPDAGTRNGPAVYLGTLDDRSDAVGADGITEVKNPGDHDLDPRGSVLFTVTDGVNNAAVSAAFYQRWHTHAAA